MTSMPASRSALATVLAPRSCPSSPGLPTSTLILSSLIACLAPCSEDPRLVVLAEFLAQHAGDLAQRAPGVRGGDEALEQVGAVAAGLAHRVERRLGGARVALAAQLGQARALLALDRGVDAVQLDLGRALALVDVAVDADDLLAALLDG